jgi:hypothetical protein
MIIRIPAIIARGFDAIVDWGDIVVIARPFACIGIGPVRRIDLLIVAAGVFCVGWYGRLYGWMGALQGGVAYVLMLFVALYARPESP